MTDNIVFSPRRRAFVNKPGQAFRAEEYTDVKGQWTYLMRGGWTGHLLSLHEVTTA